MRPKNSTTPPSAQEALLAQTMPIILIADESIVQLDAAIETIFRLEALFKAISKEVDQRTEVARLIALGQHVAQDQGNAFDCLRESLQEKLEQFAPQNANNENVARESGASV